MKTLPLFLLFLLSLSVKSENLDSLLDICVKSLGKPLDSAKMNALRYLSEAKTANDKFHLVRAHFFLGHISNQSEDFDNAVIYYLEGARLGEGQRDKKIQEDLISMYKNLANILDEYKHYDLTHKFIDRALEIAKSTGNLKQEIALLTNRIHEFIDEKRFTEALNQISVLLDQYPLENSDRVSLKNKEGNVYKELGNLKKAKQCYEKNLQLTLPDDSYYAYAQHNIGDIYLISGDYDSAKIFFRKAIETKASIALDQNLISSYRDLAKVYFLEKEYAQAISLLKKAEKIDVEKYSNPDSYTIYELTSKVYEEMGDTKSALHYKDIYLKKFSEKDPIMELLTERHFELLEEHLEKLEYEKLARLGIQGVVIVSVTATSIIFIILYRQRRARKKLVPVAIDSDRPLMTRQELARELGISYHTLWRRLQESDIKITSRKYLTPTEQEEIINYLKKKKK